MPQLIFFALVALVVYWPYNSLPRAAAPVSARVRRHEKQAKNGANGTLIKDPATGEYRLAKD
jgi:hypothetical protein